MTTKGGAHVPVAAATAGEGLAVLGVQIGEDGPVIFGSPLYHYEPEHPAPDWLGGLTADEYARILGRAS